MWEFSLGASREKGGVFNGEIERRGNVGIQIEVKNDWRLSSFAIQILVNGFN